MTAHGDLSELKRTSLAASSRSVVAGLTAGGVFLPAHSYWFSLLRSGEVIYGQPWWYDKLIYN